MVQWSRIQSRKYFLGAQYGTMVENSVKDPQGKPPASGRTSYSLPTEETPGANPNFGKEFRLK